MEIAYEVLQERIDEIQSYLDFLYALDSANKSGAPMVRPDQYHILIANTFVLMYNMIEATVIQSVKCLEEVISSDKECPKNLSQKLKDEWISNFLGTNEPLNHRKRLRRGLNFYEHIIGAQPLTLVISTGSGGNWDDEEIYRLAKRLGIDLSSIPPSVYACIKNKLYDEMGCLKFIVRKRNKLAHGEISFSECGREEELTKIKKIFIDTSQYLKAVVSSFDIFSRQRQFLTTG